MTQPLQGQPYPPRVPAPPYPPVPQPGPYVPVGPGTVAPLGYHYARPGPMTVAPRPSWHGPWGLGCSVAAVALPLLALLLQFVADGAVPLALLILLSPVAAVLGIVFSSIGMSRRYSRRGLAIAGLVVGILVAVLALVILVGVLSSL